MGSWHLFIFIFLCCYTELARCQYGQKQNPIEEYSDHKDFKQLLRTRTNVMVLFMKQLSESAPIYKACRETALEVRGIGTLIVVDCNGAGKKLCKKLKANPETHVLHHFKDGKFSKVYDRKDTVKSMVRFMNDPTGDVPWEEEPSGKNVVHLGSPGSLDKLVKRNKPVLVMFYAPWCVYCKQMKPDFAAAAARVKANGDGTLAAMDVLRPENIHVRTKYNITGFPTLYYFKNGKAVKTYDGDNKEENFVAFMKDPMAVVTPTKETDWADTVTDVVHLNADNFDFTLSEEKSVLVMFYAPWCGHCKKMKPDYEKAAAFMKKENIPGILAAVDSTKETALSEKYAVSGFPTIKYFRNSEFAFNTPHLRDFSKLIEFMKQPKEPPPEPPPEPAWADVESEVVHLTEESFKVQLRSKRNALVMFYAPWCGHCKQAKPEFTSAAEQLKDLSRTILAAVDCDQHRALCKFNDIKGYPTFKYFRYYNKEAPQDYSGGRSAGDFVKYMSQFEEIQYSTAAVEKQASNLVLESKEAKPAVETQTAKPAVVESKEPKPAVEKQTAKPAVESKEVKPAVEKQTAKPAVEKQTVKPAVEKQTAKPAVKSKEAKPAVEKQTAKPAVESNEAKPAMENVAAENKETKPKTAKRQKTKPFVDKPDSKSTLGKQEPKVAEEKIKSVPTSDNVIKKGDADKIKGGDDIWSQFDGGNKIIQINSNNFNSILAKYSSIVVLFHASWCSKCTEMKPDYVLAAQIVATNYGVFGACDVSVSANIADTYRIEGLPTVKYFKNGVEKATFSGTMNTENLVAFLKNGGNSKKDEL